MITKFVAGEDCPNVSVAVKVMGTTACNEGVPETTPVTELSDSPSAGRPVALHVSAPVPLAWKVKTYISPAAPPETFA